MKWAIVGSGFIANEFASGMQEVKDATLVATVSRKVDTGKAFAEKYGCQTVYTNYTEMLDTEEIDVVYIGIPNDCHYDYIMEALERGIPVLSEKPMVDNEWQLKNVLAKAKEKNTFLMEGMWTRCFPAVGKVREWIKEGKIGTPLSVHSAFNIKPAMDEWQPWKGGIGHAGGSLRDVGIYSLAMANMVFPEEPKRISSSMEFNGEVDESCHLLLEYTDGKTAMIGGAFNQISSHVTEIIGEKGRITIGPEFWHPTTATFIANDGTQEEYVETYPASGFQYEIQEVQKCLQEGTLESRKFTWNESIQIGSIIEKTRKGWGIVYKSDSENPVT